MTKAEQIFEKHIGLNAELGYLPIKKQDVIDAINEALTIQRVSQKQTGQFTQDAFNSSIFNNALIGKKDSNGVRPTIYFCSNLVFISNFDREKEFITI